MRTLRQGPLLAASAAAALLLTNCAEPESEPEQSPATEASDTVAPEVTQEPESTDGTDEPESQAPQPVEVIEPVWQIEADLVGSPAMAAGVVVSYIRNEDDSFDAMAWDAGTQEELWRVSAASGDADPLHTVTLEDSIGEYDGGHYVSFLQEADVNNTAVVLDLHSGEQLVDQPVYSYTRPALCLDSENACFDGQAGAMDEMRTMQLHPNTGEISQLTAGTEGALPSGYPIRLDESLFIDTFTNTEDTELVYAPAGEPVWESSYHTIFGEGFSAQRSWNFQPHDNAPERIGSWARTIPAEELAEAAELLAAGEDPEPVTINIPDDVHFAMLEQETGELVWDQSGLDDCPGGGPRNQGELMILCQWTAGEYEMDPESGDFAGEPVVEESLAAVGIDPATGETVWSVPVDAGSLGNIVVREPTNFRQVPGQVLATVDGEPTVIDTESGETRSAGDDELFVCSARRDEVTAQRQSGEAQASAGTDLFLCDSSGTDAEEQAFPLHLLEAAATAYDDEIALVGHEGRLVAYDISETTFDADPSTPEED